MQKRILKFLEQEKGKREKRRVSEDKETERGEEGAFVNPLAKLIAREDTSVRV